jgi:hypothetical protein
MITILWNFYQFSAEKNGIFLKKQCYDQIFEKKVAVVLAQNANIFANFLVKIFKKS